MTPRTLLVTGATGAQGGATVDALLAQGRTQGDRWHIRALVRTPTSERAQALARRGVELVQGDLTDLPSVRSAVAGAYGVFSVQTPMEDGPDGEARQGKALADAAAEAGVAHVVYTSAGGAERDSGVPHFESKWLIEQHIAALGLPATVLRPAAFMDNFKTAQFRTIMLSMMRTFLSDSQPLQLVAARDIGWFAADAFANPDRYLGQAIELAGDAVTRPQAVEVLRRAGLRPAVSLRFPRLMHRWLPEEYRRMFEWMALEGFQADVGALRRAHPGLLTIETWAKHEASAHTTPAQGPRAAGAEASPPRPPA